MSKISRTERALRWMSAEPGRTPYAAARYYGLSPSVIYRAIASRNLRRRCPTCGRPL